MIYIDMIQYHRKLHLFHTLHEPPRVISKQPRMAVTDSRLTVTDNERHVPLWYITGECLQAEEHPPLQCTRQGGLSTKHRGELDFRVAIRYPYGSGKQWTTRTSPVYQWRKAFLRNMAVNCSLTLLNISWMAVVLPRKVALIFSPFGGISHTCATETNPSGHWERSQPFERHSNCAQKSNHQDTKRRSQQLGRVIRKEQ